MVSTVFLGTDRAFGYSLTPILFETMVFLDGDGDNDCERCSDWREAEFQHHMMVEEWTAKLAGSRKAQTD
jgi:hypothetical protein